MVTRPLLIFLGAFAAVLMSFTALALFPTLQLTAIEPTPDRIPYSYEAARGREVYAAEGCVYCHTQQVRPEGFGSDIARGWGTRGSLPGDYVYDRPHLLGTMRTGPDLHDVGSRQPSIDWHLGHFYQPRSVTPGSVMPSYPYLFELKHRRQVRSSWPTVSMGGEVAGRDSNMVLVPTEEAMALYEYLMTLRVRPLELES